MKKLIDLVRLPTTFVAKHIAEIMEPSSLLRRISIDPAICHGKPVIRGLRYPVESILEYLAAGDTIDDILAEFSDLEPEDILACLAFAAHVIKTKSVYVYPIAA